ncbi:MAG: hypothetical protein ABEH56_08920 [Salinirussus sp.]
MESGAATPGSARDGVMCAVEEGQVDRLVIADVRRDDSYITAPLADAASLPAWR